MLRASPKTPRKTPPMNEQIQTPLPKGRRGGRRPGAGRPRVRPIPATVRAAVISETTIEVLQALKRIQRALAAQDARLDRLAQQKRDAGEHGPMILRRLTELERLVRGDPGLVAVTKHTPRDRKSTRLNSSHRL